MPSGSRSTWPCSAEALDTLSVPPLGSWSLASTSRTTWPSSFTLARSATATGSALLTSSRSAVLVLAPDRSVAVTRIGTTPVPPSRKLSSASVPEISPVAASITRPVGRPVAEKLSRSPCVSRLPSLKALAVAIDTVAPASACTSASRPAVGARLVATFTVTVTTSSAPPERTV